MAYSDFTLAKVIEAFELSLEESIDLFAELEVIKPSELLTLTLKDYIPLATATNTEKARSEFLIAPILTEARRQLKNKISLFSGAEFNVDFEKGLVGFLDFILTKSRKQYYINAPIITIVGAKNENIKAGLGQCIAAMIAAQLFNKKAENEIKLIYGVVTSGTVWKFLVLEDKAIFIDYSEYYIKEVGKILAILLNPIKKTE